MSMHGYNSSVEELRKTEFAHAEGVVYLDHAGATLYARSQLEDHVLDLSSSLYGNPHSQNPSSRLSTDAIDHVRDLVLEHFGTNSHEYDVIFTSGCTGALKLLSEIFPWEEGRVGEQGLGSPHEVLYKGSGSGTCHSSNCGSCLGSVPTLHASDHHGLGRSIFAYLEDNHTSVLGIREVAAEHNAGLVCFTKDAIVEIANTGSKNTVNGERSVHDSGLRGDHHHADAENWERKGGPFHLFAYPAQSNFSGFKYPLSWTYQIRRRKAVISGLEKVDGEWLVLLDAAAYVATNPLDLSAHPADFVTVSFYKIFGYPTGVGALLVQRGRAREMRRNYFGGGTVQTSIARKRFHVPRVELHERFEDGTVPFLSIIALRHGFEVLKRLGITMASISAHTYTLAHYVYTRLSSLRHYNKQKVCVLYSDREFCRERQGGIIAFNLVRADGRFVGYSEVDKLACVHCIHLRTGCFCNPGACQSHLGLTNECIIKNMEAGHTCGDSVDLVDGLPTGCVRVSFGYMSALADAEKLVHFISECFVERASLPLKEDERSGDSTPPTGAGSENGSGKGDSEPESCQLQSDLASGNDPPQALTRSSGTPEPEISRPGSHNSGRDEMLPAHLDAERKEREVVSLAGMGTRSSEEDLLIRVGSEVRATSTSGVTSEFVLESILLYPVKSCAALQVDSWPVCSHGLRWDREWAVLSEKGACLSQKQEPMMATIVPAVDLWTDLLTLHCRKWGGEEETVVIVGGDAVNDASRPLCQTRVCGDRVQGWDCGQEASLWLSYVLHRKCRLVRMSPDHQREARRQPVGAKGVTLSLSNEAQFLLISQASVKYIHKRMVDRCPQEKWPSPDQLALRFRPNFIVSGDLEPFAEEMWTHIEMGDHTFQVVGSCTRCHMICVDQGLGKRENREPLQTLMAERGSKAHFGIYLARMTSESQYNRHVHV